MGVYILGGYHALATSSFLPNRYTEWESGPTLPSPGNYDACAVAVSDTAFLLIGGYPTTRQVVEYDTTSLAWTQWPELEEERYGHACARLGDNIIIAGGSYASWPKTETTILDINSRRQRVGGPMAVGREGFSLARLGGGAGGLLALGGNMHAGGLDSIEMWDESTEQWRTTDLVDKLDQPRGGFSALSIPLGEVCNV